MTKTELAHKLVKKMPGAPARTLARRLRTDYPQLFPSIENARKSVLYVVGRMGAKNRKHIPADDVRPARAAGMKPSFPESSAEDWAPVVLPVPGVVLSLSDLHVPYHDKRAIETAVAHAKRRHKITDLVLNGDYADFYQVSRFQRNPSKRSMRGEIDDQKAGLVWLARQFKNARRWYKLGNHDVRWDHYVWHNSPILADCEHMQLHNILQFDITGFHRVDDQPIMAGRLPILHGHELGQGGATSPVNPARGLFMKTLDSALIGHHHQTSSHAGTTMWHKERMTWSQGCLCHLNPEYARVNKWNQGFAVIETAKDGTYNVVNYRIGADYAVRQS